jgi:hypothetical protein
LALSDLKYTTQELARVIPRLIDEWSSVYWFKSMGNSAPIDLLLIHTVNEAVLIYSYLRLLNKDRSYLNY